MPSLQTRIEALAAVFASGVLEAIRGASLDDLRGEMSRGASPARPGRRRARGPAAGTTTATATPASAAPAAPRRRGRPRRLARRSASDLQHVIGLITSALGQATKGLRSEELQKALKLGKKEIVRPIELALKAKRITKKGQKRATTYFAR